MPTTRIKAKINPARSISKKTPTKRKPDFLSTHLREYFGFNSFKDSQEAIIANVLDGKDTFVIM
ncbi:MAG: hypothetical protein ABIO82_02005, partial [Ginsengibacter sp.]